MEQTNYDWKKNFLFGGLAAGTGLFGYLVGRSKSFRGISITLMAIAATFYLPRACDTLDKYMQNRNQMEFYKLKQEYKKDSIENVVRMEEIRKDSIYSKFDDLIKKHDKRYYETFSKQQTIMRQTLKEITAKKSEVEELSQDMIFLENRVYEVLEKNGFKKVPRTTGN